MRVGIVGNFGLAGNQTMAMRALPIARQLASRGHDVRMGLPVRVPADIAGSTFDDGVEVSLFSARLPFGPQCYVLQILKMALWCLRRQPSALYCFKPVAHSGAILAIFLVLRRLGIYHGSLILDTDDWEGDGGWNEKHQLRWWVKRLIAWQERWSLRHADVVVAASLELARMAGDLGAKDVAYAPNCMEDGSPECTTDSVLRHGEATGASSRPVILVYTRFVEYRIERLVDTFEAILKREPAVTFVVAGTGLGGEEDELREVLTTRGIAYSCRLTGWVSREDLPSLLASTDLALYLLDDNLLNRTKCPMKLVELTSAGVPVVADRVGQAAEYLEDGLTGILVEPGNVRAMAEEAVKLLSDPTRRQEMAARARERASRWRWSAWAPVIEKALIGGPSRP